MGAAVIHVLIDRLVACNDRSDNGVQMGIECGLIRRTAVDTHSYATAMLMAGMTPAFCAKQLGHSVEMFLTTYSKWIDGNQNVIEMARLESTISSPQPPQKCAEST
ncbi:hypothetical protein [Burkholderia ubonensis]|uniref:hypothetical protein n=1 Tax=Burkholderia ubonensis TaxID=101571 RepID=UPI001E505564|nr:hypothetical protein [Burkholderia ubonensis]